MLAWIIGQFFLNIFILFTSSIFAFDHFILLFFLYFWWKCNVFIYLLWLLPTFLYEKGLFYELQCTYEFSYFYVEILNNILFFKILEKIILQAYTVCACLYLNLLINNVNIFTIYMYNNIHCTYFSNMFWIQYGHRI